MLREINAANFDFDDPGWAKISSDGRELVKTRARCARPAHGLRRLAAPVLRRGRQPRHQYVESLAVTVRQTSTRP